MEQWHSLSPADPELFARLRELGQVPVCVRFGAGLGDGLHVEIPATRLMAEGRLRVEPDVDRFAVQISGWGDDNFAWFARRRGRGGPDYWQGAMEYCPEGRPGLVLYFTAPLDGLEIRVCLDAPGDCC